MDPGWRSFTARMIAKIRGDGGAAVFFDGHEFTPLPAR
jgi:hypothetical protein